jgi:hypothetical protein
MTTRQYKKITDFWTICALAGLVISVSGLVIVLAHAIVSVL